MFSVTIENSRDGVILHCQGSLVRGEETGLLCAAVQHHGRNVVLDFRNVSTMDAAGIGALISLQTAGVYLKLENPTKPVREILRVTGLNSIFEICDTQSPAGAENRRQESSAMAVAHIE